ncbi:hypothetical protein WMO79_01250 [Micrococcaceae bacterium Sec7.4]
MATASSALAERFWPAVPERIWDSIRDEFTLPTAADLEAHFEARGDAEAMRRAMRVFIGDGTFCPDFQLKDGRFHEPVLRLFGQAMDLKIPHNVFAAWMVSPLPVAGTRPVDTLETLQLLQDALTLFADRYRPVEEGRSRR